MNIIEINSKFVDQIKDRITGSSIVEALSDALPLNKEAIYRRLRAEVPFTYAEAVLISHKLNISLDELNMNPNSFFVFKIDKKTGGSSEDVYIRSLRFNMEAIKGFIDPQDLHLSILSGMIGNIPLTFMFGYENLSKFRYLKWLYENRNLQIQKQKFSEISISQSYIDVNKEFGCLLQQMNNIFILPSDMVLHFLTLVKHFIMLNLIEEADIELIKADLYRLIDDLEEIVATGKCPGGGNITIYTTDVSLMSTCVSVENVVSQKRIISIGIFANNIAMSDNAQICNMFKQAFEDYKDYTTLITKSGASIRKDFINRQRQLIANYLG